MIQLGDIAKDSITGFKGMVVTDIQHIHGCRRLALQPQDLGKDGKPVEPMVFDEPQLVLVKAIKIKSLPLPQVRVIGGPRNDAKVMQRRVELAARR